MKDQRKRFSGDFKTKVAVEAIKGHRTATEIAGEYGVHPNQITQWKKQALEGLPELLSDKRKKREMDQEDLAAQLYQQIGRLKVELDWLKKSWICLFLRANELLSRRIIRTCRLPDSVSSWGWPAQVGTTYLRRCQATNSN